MQSGPSINDVLNALGKLGSRKVLPFLIALGVPTNVIEEAEFNYTRDISRVKYEGLSWWFKNNTPSWEAITKALREPSVQEYVLAQTITLKFSTKGIIHINITQNDSTYQLYIYVPRNICSC